MKNSKYGRILAAATTVFAILLGILFIICCAHLYFTGGEQPYSRERVGDYLIILAVPSFITIALTIAAESLSYIAFRHAIVAEANKTLATRLIKEVEEYYKDNDIKNFKK